MSNALFLPPAEKWERLSPKYLWAKLVATVVSNTLWVAISTGAVYLLLADSDYFFMVWVIAGLNLVWFLWRVLRCPRLVRSWGYAERDDDVYVTYGIWSKKLTCVPYGRMQLVEVHSGPVERLFGLARVRMVTASSSGSVDIPGLDIEAAKTVRDKFIALGKSLQEAI